MVEFFIGFGIIILLCVAALIIDSKRSHAVADNLAAEYSAMREQGLVPRRSRRFQRLSTTEGDAQAEANQNAPGTDQLHVLSETFSS